MPLDPQTIALAVSQARSALVKLDDADAEIRKAKLAQLDVAQHEADSKAQRAKLNAFLAVYGR